MSELPLCNRQDPTVGGPETLNLHFDPSRFRAKSEPLINIQGHLHGQVQTFKDFCLQADLAVTVLHVPYSLDSGVQQSLKRDYRGTSLIRNRPPIVPYSRAMPRALWWS